MLTDREIAIYALGKTEGVHSIAETLGKGLDDEKYIQSWKKTMSLLDIDMPLEDLERIYNEFCQEDGSRGQEQREGIPEPKCRNVKSFHMLLMFGIT